MPYQVGTFEPIPTIEVQIQKFWKENRIFERSVEERPKDNTYVLYDGPPFATGLPHYGHVLAGALKDVFPRYHTMQGKRVERRFGWDCHGVPVEYGVQQEKGIKDIQSFGVANFNEECRNVVLRYTAEWKALVERLGRFVDMENDYKTMDPEFMESVWAVFKKIHEKGLVYEDKRVVAYSPGLTTPLSNFEAALNYKNVQDPQITVEFPLEEDPNTSFLVWTTTPWTVPSNVAIAINPQVEYSKVTLHSGKSYILATDLIDANFEAALVQSKKVMPVDALIGKRYVPMFECVPEEDRERSFKIIESSHVTATDGTGLVHISPAFGEDDYKLGKKHNLPILDFFDKNGVLNEGLPREAAALNEKVRGQDFKSADKALIRFMKSKGRVLHHKTAEHSYPHCWRTDKPLMYRAVPSWYIEVTKIKDRLVENNKEIAWYPDNVGSGRFENWLKDARDWSISRNRSWGCPIPVWRNVSDSTDCIVIGSIEELKELTGESDIPDIHSHKIDHLVVKKEGKTYQRIPEVFDCWFESGAMPYAQSHYPFAPGGEAEFLKRNFPADFIAEGIDQTRGWFYTLLIIGTALFDTAPFKNCVVNGILLGDDGQKMSKSKKNYPPLEGVLEKYGADALRFVLLGSPATRAQALAVKDKTIHSAAKNLLIPITNLYKFFAEEANLLNVQFDDKPLNAQLVVHELDKWLVYRTEMFKSKMTEYMNSYDLMSSCAEIQSYVDDLSKWYVRNIKTNLRHINYANKAESLQCLFTALETLSKCAAPIIPFASEFIYQKLFGMEHSVHLKNWPVAIPVPEFKATFDELETVRNIIHIGQAVREENKLPVRQPLSTLYLSSDLRSIVTRNESLIRESLNIDNIEWIDAMSDMLTASVELNHKVVGPKYLEEVKDIQIAVKEGNYILKEDMLLVGGKTLKLSDDEFSIKYTPKKEHVAGTRKGLLWVALNTNVTPELLERYQLRTLERTIQDARKQLELKKTDRIQLVISGGIVPLVEKYEAEFKQKVGADIVTLKEVSQQTPDSTQKISLAGQIDGEISIYRAVSATTSLSTSAWKKLGAPRSDEKREKQPIEGSRHDDIKGAGSNSEGSSHQRRKNKSRTS